MDFVDKALKCSTERWKEKENYQLLLFEDVEDMCEAIRMQEKKYTLCRMIAGFAWDWETKGEDFDTIKRRGLYDIDIEGNHYVWNTTDKDWINSAHSIDEIGCIHTTQGFDLNYAGIIIGPELDYDPNTNKLVVFRDRYKDVMGKVNTGNGKDLREYILNIYKTLLARGIRGTYIYACNPNMKTYLSGILPVVKHVSIE